MSKSGVARSELLRDCGSSHRHGSDAVPLLGFSDRAVDIWLQVTHLTDIPSVDVVEVVKVRVLTHVC